MPKVEGTGTLQAVDRAVQILRALADAPRPKTLQELSEEIGVSSSTIHRMLATLGRHHLVEKDPVTRRYALGLGLLGLADARIRQLDLIRYARPHLESLRELSHETVSVYVVRGDSMTCIDRSESPHSLRQNVEVGRPLAFAELGATAKAVLAYLPAVQQERVLDSVQWECRAITREQVERDLADIRHGKLARSFNERGQGASALASAAWDHQRQAVASLAISGPVGRFTHQAMDALEEPLRQAAMDISRHLGYPVLPGANGHVPAAARV